MTIGSLCASVLASRQDCGVLSLPRSLRLLLLGNWSLKASDKLIKGKQ